MLSNGQDVVGALCARDYKGVGSQFVDEGKVIVQEGDDMSKEARGKYVVRRLTPL